MNLDKLKKHFPELVFEVNEVLAPYTFMKVGGRAMAFVDVKNVINLETLSSFCFLEEIPFIVLGGGSNVIVPDEGLDKLVIHNLTSEITFNPKGEDLVEVTADSGVVTAILAAKTIEKGLTGFEYFVGVPGSIGGAIVNNSHFTSADLVGNNVVSVRVCAENGKIEVWPVEKLKFDYDYSIFHEVKAVVLSATFLFKKSESSMIEDHVKKAALKRVSTQPLGVPSSGCMYRNPIISKDGFDVLSSKLEVTEGAYKLRDDGRYQVAAGFLIDKAGLKGEKVGDASVSDKHATYILNTGKATASDVEQLCNRVESVVKQKFDVTLEREVFFLK